MNNKPYQSLLAGREIKQTNNYIAFSSSASEIHPTGIST
jgi:hypothetical protein